MTPKQLNLTESELTRLEEILDNPECDWRVCRRATVLKNIHEKYSYGEIVAFGHTSSATISNIKRRFFERGLEHALFELPRSGAPIRISPHDEDAIISLASTPPPEGYARWTLRLLAQKAVENGFVSSISHNQIGLILKKKNHSLVEKQFSDEDIE